MPKGLQEYRLEKGIGRGCLIPIWFNISTVHLESLGMVQDCKEIAGSMSCTNIKARLFFTLPHNFSHQERVKASLECCY